MRRAAFLILLMLLCAPSAARGHAWSAPQELGRGTVGELATNAAGATVALWGDFPSGGSAAAFAAPGAPFGPAERVAPGHPIVRDAVVAGNGDAAAVVRSVGWPVTQRLMVRDVAGVWTDAGIPSDDVGRVHALADGTLISVSGRRVWRRPAGGTWTATTLARSAGTSAVAGDRLFAGFTDTGRLEVAEVAPDGTIGPADEVSTEGAIQYQLAAGPSGDVIAEWLHYDTRELQAAVARPGQPFTAPSRLVLAPTERGRPAVAADGSTATAWGHETYQPQGFAAGAPGAAPTPSADPFPRRRDNPLALGFDAADTLLGLVKRAEPHRATGRLVGRVEVAARIGGAWCPPEVLWSGLAGYGLRLAFDRVGRGAALFGDQDSGRILAARYTARNSCPPEPPPLDLGSAPQDPPPPSPPAPPTPAPTTSAAPPPAAPRTAVAAVPARARLLLPARAIVSRRGTVRLALSCGPAAHCAGTLELRRDRTLWTRTTFTVPAGGRRTVTLRLGPAARRASARRPSTRVTTVTRLTGRGATRTAITLRRAR